MSKIYKLNDPKVWAMPVKDSKEPFVEVSKKYPRLFYDRTRKNVYKYSEPALFLRRGVAERLLIAQNYLPKGIILKIKEGHRPLKVQKIIYDEHLAHLRIKYPGKSEKFYKDKAVEWVAPPGNIPPHSTGGAVDLTLMTTKGKELDMGQRVNDGGSASSTFAKNITSLAKKNRKILIKTMERAGFVNYPHEWWHWSYGDRYWAFISKSNHAIYGSKK